MKIMVSACLAGENCKYTAATTGMTFLSSRLYLKLTGEQIELIRGEVSFSIIDKYKGSN